MQDSLAVHKIDGHKIDGDWIDGHWINGHVLLLVLFALALANLTGVLGSRVHGQDRITLTQEQWETGFNAFAQIIRKRKINLLANYDQWREFPANRRVLILMGRVSLEDQRYLAEFVESGGSALLATDVDFGQ